jgi:hypothetical protein
MMHDEWDSRTKTKQDLWMTAGKRRAMQKEWVSRAGEGRRCGAVSNGTAQMPQGHRPMAQARGYCTRDDIKVLVGTRTTLPRTHRHFYPHATLHKMQLCPLNPYSPTSCEKKLAKLSQRYG